MMMVLRFMTLRAANGASLVAFESCRKRHLLSPELNTASSWISSRLDRMDLHLDHLATKGFALFHGSVAARLHRASRLAVRACSLMAKSSSRGAMGSVDERTSCDRSYDREELVEELVDEMDDVLRALERRRGWEMELKRMATSGWLFGLWWVMLVACSCGGGMLLWFGGGRCVGTRLLSS